MSIIQYVVIHVHIAQNHINICKKGSFFEYYDVNTTVGVLLYLNTPHKTQRIIHYSLNDNVKMSENNHQ